MREGSRGWIAAALLCLWALTGGVGAMAEAEAQGVAAGAATGELRLLLEGGDVVSGVLIEEDAEAVTIEHAALGELVVPRSAIVESSLLTGSAEVAAETEAASSAARAIGAEASAVNPAAGAPEAEADTGEPEVPTWHGDASLGIDGSQGNAERSSIRMAAAAERETEDNVWDLDIAYSRAEDDGSLSESKIISNARHDWLFNSSSWEVFAKGLFEFDEMKDFDYRLAATVGPAYRFIKTDTMKLTGRVGLGASREFGGEDEEVVPEAMLGAGFNWAVVKGQKFKSSIEVLPSLTEGGEFRAIALVAYDIELSVPLALSLRLGIEDRYDSQSAADTDSNDLDYFASVVRKY